MKILLLQDYLRNGGTERQTCTLANAFADAGHRVHVATFRPGGVLAGQLHSSVGRVTLQSRDTHWDWFAPGLRRTVRMLAPEVVLLMGRMANCYGSWVKRAVPESVVIATMRTGQRLPLLFRTSLRSADHVVANSHDSAHVLTRDYGVAEAKLSVIHNGLVFAQVPPEQARAARLKLRSDAGVARDAHVMLVVGMFRRGKHREECVEIARGLPQGVDWHLWFVGDGETRASCERLVTEYQLQERVRFWGFQSDPTPFYAAADVALLTSTTESLSNFLIEAHAHGVPSIAYRTTGIPECGGLVIAPGDRAAFVARLTQVLLAPPEEKVNEARRVREFALAHFTHEAQHRAYEMLFARLVAGRGAERAGDS